MFLYFYLGTTAFVWYDTFKSMIVMHRRLKKEGYKFTVPNHFGIGDVVIGTIFLVALSLPVVNLIFPLASVDKDEAYMWYKDKLLDDGAIEKEDDEDIETVDLEQKNIIEIQNAKLVERINKEGHIYYSPMNKQEDDAIEFGGYTYKKVRK